jgi:hypothetical protein
VKRRLKYILSCWENCFYRSSHRRVPKRDQIFHIINQTQYCDQDMKWKVEESDFQRAPAPNKSWQKFRSIIEALITSALACRMKIHSSHCKWRMTTESKMAKDTVLYYLPLMFFTLVVNLNIKILVIYKRIEWTDSRHELGKAYWKLKHAF